MGSMKTNALRRTWTLAILLGVAGLVLAHVRLTYTVNGNALFWQSPNNVSIVINSTGSDDITDGSHETALRSAIQTWNDDNRTAAQLVENASVSQQARVDWGSSGVHLMLFDETNSSGFFPGFSGIVAITPVSFFTTGPIIDADVLFNGKNFDFTTEGLSGDFDVQNVATHELGHLLGLDHSGWASATMYPYVDQGTQLQRSLSMDDIRGLRHVYPNGSFGRITGTVRRVSDGTIVTGAHVVARDADGRTAGSRLSDGSGVFRIEALDAGDYTVYATPLDQPVSAGNVGLPFAVAVDFESTALGSATVTTGVTTAMGDVTVGAAVALTLGRSSNDFPMRVVRGQTVGPMTLFGTGLTAGSTLLSSDLDGAPVVVNVTSWTGTAVQFTVAVPAGAPSGHLDLTVINGTGTRTLPAALEITPPNPAVGTVSPSSGDVAGGVNLLIQGVGFNAGSRVVIADRIYRDGDIGGCVVVDANTITLTTAGSTVPFSGLHDVVVLDPSGTEGRNANAFQITVTPTIATLFPNAGAAAGGTDVVLTGADFALDANVSIDGVQQSVTSQSLSQLSFSTVGGTAGIHTLTLDNNGGLAMVAFTYSTGSDPQVSAVIPPIGIETGGQVVEILGSDFTATSEVFFGANAASGLGGVPAASVTLVDSNTLTVVTPTHSPGAKSLLVRQSDTAQSVLVPAAFTFQEVARPVSGGCGSITPGTPPTPGEMLSGGGWFLAVLGLLLLQARNRRRLQPQRV
ncbi:MAG: hypothetical protein ACI8QZ_003534 [Chlamydiales bacterium]|jgi:hypothetical protein